MVGVCVRKVQILATVLFAILAVMYFWPVKYHCSTELKVTLPGLALKGRSEDLANIQFRVKGAIDHMKDPHVFSELCRKYVQSVPDSSEDEVRKLIENVRVMPSGDRNGLLWTVESVSTAPDKARRLSTFYADLLIKYFDDERNGLVEKMTAWFDQQIYHKRKRNEDVRNLENKKYAILARERSNALVVQTFGMPKEWYTLW